MDNKIFFYLLMRFTFSECKLSARNVAYIDIEDTFIVFTPIFGSPNNKCPIKPHLFVKNRIKIDYLYFNNIKL